MNYTTTKIEGQKLAYSVTAERGGKEFAFTVVCASDESEIPDLVAHHLDFLDAPEPVYLPVPDYLAFWDALMTSSVYGSIREQSFVSLPMNTLATEFIALIGDAKAGRANEAAIQQSMSAILATGTFTEGDLVELQGVLEAGNLDGIYTLGAI
jgi:hypothetical protein